MVVPLVVILSEPSDEPQALRVAHLLEALGVRCWVEGVEGQDAMSRPQALAGCHAIVVVLDEGGGAYGAIDAGATWKVPVFMLGREAQQDRSQLRPFCERIATAVGAAERSPGRRGLRGLSGRRLLAAGAALGVVAALGVLGLRFVRSTGERPSLARHEAIGLTASPTGSGWVLAFRLPAPPVELWYDLGTGAGFHQTGVQPGAFDPATGAPLAESYVMVGQEELPGPTTVRVKFRRSGGAMEGPFELPLDPDAQAQAAARSALEDMAPRWVTFGDLRGQPLVYFTPVLAFKHALREIQVGVDEGPIDQSVRFAPSRQPGVSAEDEVFRALPSGVRSVSIGLVLRDGSRLPVRTFPVAMTQSPPSPPRPIPALFKTKAPRPARDLIDPWATRVQDTRH
jgi:hypothetical protein